RRTTSTHQTHPPTAAITPTRTRVRPRNPTRKNRSTVHLLSAYPAGHTCRTAVTTLAARPADQREPPRFCCNLASISLALRWFSGLAASRRTIWIALTAAALFIALPNIPIEHSSACRSEPYFHDTDARKHRRGTAAGGTGPFGWNAPVRAAQFAESATRLFGNFQPGRGKWQVYPFGYRWR